MAVALWENPNYEELNSDKEESKEIVYSVLSCLFAPQGCHQQQGHYECDSR